MKMMEIRDDKETTSTNLLTKVQAASANARERASYDKPKVKYPSDDKYYIYIITAVAAINSCNLGYDQSIIASVGPLLLDQTQFKVSEVQLEVFIGILDFASLLGAATSNIVADKYGRKGCLRFAAIIFAVSVLGMAISQDYATLLTFRFLTGIGVGIGLSIDPMYIGEVAPSEKRGKLISCAELAINIGILLGFAFGAALHGLAKDLGWRIMLALGALMPVILLILLLYMPETPRWLVLNGREAEAEQVLKDVYDNGVDTAEMLVGIKESIAREQALNATHGGWEAIYRPTPSMRRSLVAGCGQGILQQLSGIEVMMNYFVFLFRKADIHVNAYIYLVVFGFLKLITVGAVAPLFDSPHFGRKKMLVISGIGVSISMFVFAVVYSPTFSDATWRGPILIATMFFYVTIFSVGYGPGTWIVIAEVFPTHLRAKGVSVATFSNRVMATLVSGTFLSSARYLSYSGVFAVLLLCGIASILFIIFFIPETQGVSLEDMAQAFGEASNHSSAAAQSVLEDGDGDEENNSNSTLQIEDSKGDDKNITSPLHGNSQEGGTA
mmetsp:Transcript_14462/g.21744  ORF Transcript_14462/g.21744 Transcript_14462/m.21744 type:complete len:555 (+) Transcript_14462:74-1738(+)